jgi:predicted Zn-dependent peptidase
MGVWIGCGSRYENESINGISHFIEHLVFKGTQKRTGDEICETIEGVGGEINASTSEESTLFYVKVVREQLDTAAEILLDMVINPLFAAEFLEKQRDIVFEEIHMYEDNPHTHAEDLFNSTLWGDHPLGFNILGSVKSMGLLSQRDIKSYKNKMYTSGNCVIAAAGDIDHKEFVRLVSRHVRGLRKGEPVKPVPVRSRRTKARFIIERRETEQVHMILGVRALPWSHRDRFALKVISTILGENMSSRLFKSVREERGYAYSINTGIDRYLDAGAFHVTAGVVTEKTVPAMRLILREMSRIAGSRVSKRELDRAKEFVRGSLAMSSEQTMSRMHWLGDNLRMWNRVTDIDKIVEAVMSVTADTVRQVAARLFRSDRLSVAIIGNPVRDEMIAKYLSFD